MVPTVRPTNDALVLRSQVVDSREELRRKITSFNNNMQGCIMSLVRVVVIESQNRHTVLFMAVRAFGMHAGYCS